MSDAPRPVPLTRPVLKAHLEAMKDRQPRIPLPELTAADRESLGANAEHYESRLRYHYLDNLELFPRMGGSNRNVGQGSGNVSAHGMVQDPQMTLDPGFKVELFWIVSRINNCHYCIGHQETKLLAAGRDEDRIASLDGDWSEFEEGERVAFEFARLFTHQPHRLDAAAIDRLRPHYSDLQIVEMMLSMAWNNSINRWKEAVGVPQNRDEGGYSRVEKGVPGIEGASAFNKDQRGSYLTPTSPRFVERTTQVAPYASGADAASATSPAVCVRPELESRDAVLARLELLKTQTTSLPLASIDVTREVMQLGETEEVPQWTRLLGHFPVEGARRGQGMLAAMRSPHLSPTLKVQLKWIAARQDRAWYMLNEARQEGKTLELDDDDLFALDGDWGSYTPREQCLFAVAKDLAASPVVLTSETVSRAVKVAGAAETVRVIHYVTQLSAVNRLTAAAGLGSGM